MSSLSVALLPWATLEWKDRKMGYISTERCKLECFQPCFQEKKQIIWIFFAKRNYSTHNPRVSQTHLWFQCRCTLPAVYSIFKCYPLTILNYCRYEVIRIDFRGSQWTWEGSTSEKNMHPVLLLCFLFFAQNVFIVLWLCLALYPERLTKDTRILLLFVFIIIKLLLLLLVHFTKHCSWTRALVLNLCGLFDNTIITTINNRNIIMMILFKRQFTFKANLRARV